MGVSVTSPNSTASLHSGQLLGRWTVGEKLGAGGTATVYRAGGPDGPVALRICRPVSVAHRDAVVGTYRSIPQHANVAQPHEVFTVDLDGSEHVVVVTDLADGPTLAERLATGALPPGEVASLIDDMVAGLAAFHRRGLVHGDVKPSNVMLFERQWKLVDPSATEPQPVDAPDPTTAVVSHERTVRYLPPEAIDTPGTSRRAGDVWALGVTVFEACTGRSPFDTMSRQLTVDYKIPQAVDSKARPVIASALTVLDERPRTVLELADRLQDGSARARSASPRRRLLVGLAVVAGITAIALTILAGPDRGTDNRTPNATAAAALADTTPSSPATTTLADALVVAPTVDQDSGDDQPEPSDDGDATGRRVDLRFDTANDIDLLAPAHDGPPDLETTVDQNRTVLRVGANNVNRPLIIDGFTTTAVAMEADVALAAFNSAEFGVEGSIHGFVLKAFADDDGQIAEAGGYVVALSPQPEGIAVWVGAARSLSATGLDYTLFGPADGHSSAARRILFPLDYGTAPGSVEELGYWRLKAQLVPEQPEPDTVAVEVWVTSPEGTTRQLSWTDDGSQANSGSGAVGMVNYGVWSIPNRWDGISVETSG